MSNVNYSARSIYLPYIPDKAPQDLCNKRFIVNLVAFVGLHRQKADISWFANIIGIKSDVYVLPLAISNETPHFQVFTTQFVYLHPLAIGLEPFGNN